MRAALVALAVAAGGCNAIFGLDPTSQGADDDAGAIVDGANSGDARTTWDTPVPVEVAASNTAVEDDPAMGPGGLELYWSASARGEAKDVYRSIRLDTDDTFVGFGSVGELNSLGSDATVRISPDGEVLWMASDRVVAGDFEVYNATRAGPAWTDLTRVDDPFSSTGADLSATPCLAGTRAVLTSTREGGDYDIFEISGAGIGYVVATDVHETSPFVTEDCLTVYFAADYGGGQGWDLHVTTRDTVDAPWSPPQVIGELSSPANEEDPWISADGRTFLFSSNRSGSWDIWEARR